MAELGRQSTASPERGTVKQHAWCKHCDEPIEKTPISQGWYHLESSSRRCLGDDDDG